MKLFPEKLIEYLLKKITRPLRRIIERYEFKNYRKLPFYKIKEIIKTKYNIKQYEYVNYNKYYQHGLVIKKFAGFIDTFKLPVSLKHGVQINTYCTAGEIENDLPGLFVFSERSKAIFSEKTDKEIYAIGPYIYYAEPLLTLEEFKKEKNRLGKSLLIMPLHSDVYAEVSYDDYEHLSKIKEIAKKFDTVRVCLHWYDIKHNMYDHYIKQGWECVSAGHEENHLFMSRLKSIIQLSDAVLSDGVSTHIGYAMLLNKPNYLVQTDMGLKNTANLDYITDELLYSFIEGPVIEEFFRIFSRYDMTITQEQRDLVDTYWGLSSLRSKEEMHEIILKLDQKHREFLSSGNK